MLKEKTNPYSAQWLEENLSENNDRDLKKEVNFLTHDGLAEFIRHCAALSNFGGGSLIVGVESNKEAGKWDICGVPPEKVHTEYDPTQIMQKINKYCSPPIHLTTSIVDYKGKSVIIIGIEGIQKSPVLIKTPFKNSGGHTLLSEGSIYIRDQTSSVPAKTEIQIRRVLDNIIYQEVQTQIAQLRHNLELLGLSPNSKEEKKNQADFEKNARNWLLKETNLPISKGRREFILYPLEYVKNVNLQQIKQIKIECNDWPFPYYAENGQNAKNTKIHGGYAHAFYSEPDFLFSNHHSGFQITEEGCFLWLGNLKEDGIRNERFKNSIGVITTQIYISCCLLYLKEILPLINNYDGKWHLIHRLVNIKNRNLIVDDPRRADFISERRCYENEISVQSQFTKSDLIKYTDDIAERLCADVYQMFNWHNPNIGQLKKDINTFHKGVVKQNVFVFK